MDPTLPFSTIGFPEPYAHVHFALARRVEELEAGFGFACEALAKLAAEIGPTAAGPVATKLRTFDTAAMNVAAAAVVQEVEALVKAGRIPAATRRYRELSGVTWDVANFTIAHWNDAPGAAERCARLIAARSRLDFLRDLAKTTP